MIVFDMIELWYTLPITFWRPSLDVNIDAGNSLQSAFSNVSLFLQELENGIPPVAELQQWEPLAEAQLGPRRARLRQIEEDSFDVSSSSQYIISSVSDKPLESYLDLSRILYIICRWRIH